MILLTHRKRWVYLILVGTCVLACSTSPIKHAEDQRAELARQVDEEIAVGRQMAAKLLGRLGESKDKEALTYLNLVGQSLAKRVGRPEITFHFGILDTDEINALATPGGYIFVTRGLLYMIHTESELAAILGHEIAHVNERHMYLKISKNKERSVTAGETIARILAHGGADVAASISAMVNEGIDILLTQGLAKEKEFEADEAGMVYAATAGYNPTSLASFLKRLHQEKQKIKLSPAYPPFIDRLKALVASLSRNALDNRTDADTTLMKERFQRALAGIAEGGNQ